MCTPIAYYDYAVCTVSYGIVVLFIYLFIYLFIWLFIYLCTFLSVSSQLLGNFRSVPVVYSKRSVMEVSVPPPLDRHCQCDTSTGRQAVARGMCFNIPLFLFTKLVNLNYYAISVSTLPFYVLRFFA